MPSSVQIIVWRRLGDKPLSGPKLAKLPDAFMRQQASMINVSYHFSYLSTKTNRQKQIRQWEANSILIFNTHQVYWNVLHWAYLCSLTEKCIAPTDDVDCEFPPGSSFNMYANCHRYDQAMLNLLLSNWNEYNEDVYTAGWDQNLLQVIRDVTQMYGLKFCT